MKAIQTKFERAERAKQKMQAAGVAFVSSEAIPKKAITSGSE
jgi:hypothetical protein